MALDFTVVLKGNILSTVPGVNSETFEDLLQFDGATYRDTIDSAVLGRDIQIKKPAYEVEEFETPVSGTVSTNIGDGEDVTIDGDIEEIGSIRIPNDGTLGDELKMFYKYNTTSFLPKQRAVDDLYFEESDEFKHEPPRPQEKKRTRIRWWSGLSFEFPISTTNNSSTITVTSTESFVTGQTVAGSGLPINTIVLSIPNGTSLVLSQKATATASVNAVISNGECKGWAWADEVRSLTSGTVRRI